MITIRRLNAIALLAVATLFASPEIANAQSASKGGVKNIVLVHGAFADGSSWAKVIAQLQEKNFNVVAVQNPLTSFDEDVAATKRAIAQMEGPVLLVGHSYGGMVISEAGKESKVAGLVYVAALVPEDGQSAQDVNAAMPTTGVEKLFNFSAEGFLSLSPQAVDQHFIQDVSLAEKKVIYAVQIPWAASATMQKVSNPAWQTKPSWSIIAAKDGMINPDLQRFKAKLIKAKTLELTSGHVPMISQPNKVTDFIVSAAQKL